MKMSDTAKRSEERERFIAHLLRTKLNANRVQCADYSTVIFQGAEVPMLSRSHL